MRRLILFRHAQARPRAAGGRDIDRPLSPGGRNDAARMGAALAKAGLAPDLALVSPAARAEETWRCARGAWPDTAVELRNGLYNATAEQVAAELDGAAERVVTVMVVGHNPSLQELAVALLEAADAPARDIERLSADFATATAAVLRIGPAGEASVEALLHVRDHGGEGG
ncbi:MAG: SixA phosphatase family protein [Caulobacteraceae bacterium]